MANTTWSTTDKTAVTLTGSNLIATATGIGFVRAADRQITGKFYWEAKPTVWVNANTGVGLCPARVTTPSGSTAVGLTAVFKSGAIWVDGAATGLTLGTRAANDVISIAVDFGAHLIWYRVAPSGNWNGSASADPATGVGGISISTVADGVFATHPLAVFGASADAVTANFGDTAFTGTAPSGFTGGFTTGATIPNSGLLTQVGTEVWTTREPAAVLTQIGLEVWEIATSVAYMTQIGLETWASVAGVSVGVLSAVGTGTMAATSALTSTIVTGAAAMAGTGTMSAVGVDLRAGAAAMIGTGAMNAVGTSIIHRGGPMITVVF